MTAKLLWHIIAFLDTQTWQRKPSVQTSEQDSEDKNVDDNAEVKETVETLAVRFAKPLESKGVNILALHVEEVVHYARKYLYISKVCYESVWYILHTCPDMVLVSPLATTHVERMFSSLKLIKTDRHTSMSNITLSDLMEVYHEGPSIQDFHADAAIQLWWERCKTNYCPNQGFRNQY